MSYALLWIETMFASLLWVGLLLACAARLKHKWASRLTKGIAAVFPFGVAFAALGAITATLKFWVHLQGSWFGYAVSLFVTYAVGSIILFVLAGRPGAPGFGRAAASWPRSRLALGFLTVVAVGTMTFWNMDLEVRAQAASLSNEAGAMMLSISPPAIPDSQNAALVYEKAFARLHADKTIGVLDSPLSPDHPDTDSPVVVAFLKHHETTIKLLRKAAKMPDCRFDHDYAHPSISMMLPELYPARNAGKLLSLHARSECSRGHVDSAVADIDAIFQLGKAVGSEPIVVSYLVAASLESMAIEALGDVLPAVSTQEQLAGLQIGEDSSDARMLARSLRGEEGFGLTLFADLAGGRTDFVYLIALMTPEKPERNYSGAIDLIAPALMRIFLIPDDVAGYRELLEGYQKSAAEPYYQTNSGAEPLRSLPRRGLITSVIAPGLSNTLLGGARAQAIHAGAQIAIAMTRYRLDHGTLPNSPELLVPNYLDEIPLDPFDGKPMRLVHKNDQWIIYSVGPDGNDDGGVPYDHQSKKGDIPFILKFNK
jgi:hypothetical protein